MWAKVTFFPKFLLNSYLFWLLKVEIDKHMYVICLCCYLSCTLWNIFHKTFTFLGCFIHYSNTSAEYIRLTRCLGYSNVGLPNLHSNPAHTDWICLHLCSSPKLQGQQHPVHWDVLGLGQLSHGLFQDRASYASQGSWQQEDGISAPGLRKCWVLAALLKPSHGKSQQMDKWPYF